MEALYHYLWQYGMFGNTLTSTSGVEVEVMHPGRHNNDAGPDFSDARLRIDGTDWVGNVEIHVKASDWERHGHHTNPAYDSVILHVVAVDDATVNRRNGETIPQVIVAPSPEFFERYASITEKIDRPGCHAWLYTLPALNKTDWISSLGIERLHEKARYMKEILHETNGDWQQALFILTARAMGFGLNGVPFEMLAKNLPLNFVMRHRDNPLQIEALAFGQAGMLDDDTYLYDEYYSRLRAEYAFLAKKYNLHPIAKDVWKYSRTRPQNFPHRRIAILCSMLAQGMQLYGILLEAKGDYDILMESLDVKAGDYWQRHARFGEAPSNMPLPSQLSKSSKEIVLINVMAPFYFAYGSLTGNYDIAEKGLDLLRDIKPERNSIIEMWSRAGLTPQCAFDSQALIHLKRNYCEKGRCLDCRFGHQILKRVMS